MNAKRADLKADPTRLEIIEGILGEVDREVLVTTKPEDTKEEIEAIAVNIGVIRLL